MKKKIQNHIIRYLVQNLKGSLLLYFVNGTPEKRLYRIRELARYIYNKMSLEDREKLYDKLKDNKPPM
tara:strand:- start:2530 stop:2733 length:204 start_codon:yes stop_codon:yes gene_type:complete